MKRHEEAGQDYIRGMTLAKIAEKYGVKITTVNSWHRTHDWAKKRKKLKKRLENTLYAKFIGHTTRSMDNYLKATELVGKICLEAIQKINPNAISAPSRLAKWMNILTQASKIHRNVVPDADDRVANAILEELKQINKGEEQN
jgi:hypothetical protein